jgi:rubrerythrin
LSDHGATVESTTSVKGGEMIIQWACDYCGHEGRTRTHDTVDSIQCPMCGEPVTLVAEYIGE